MNKYIHLHFYGRLSAILIILIASVFLLQKFDIGIAQSTPPNSIEIGGWAWNESVGWISLNCKNDFDGDGLLEDTCSSYPYGLEVSEVGNVVGCAWGGTSRNASSSNTIGYICFSDPGSTMAPTYGTYIVNQTGQCTSATTCSFDSQCNVAGDDKWRCTGGFCQVECSADNEATVCSSGICSLIQGLNNLCSTDIKDLSSCLFGSYPTSTLPSILDLEIYEGLQSKLYFPKDTALIGSSTAGIAYGGTAFDSDNPNLYWDGGIYDAWDNPIEGCFNCYQKNAGTCYYAGGITSCTDEDTVCQDLPDLPDTCLADNTCQRRGTECVDGTDCPDIETGTDYCEVTDIEYRCDNCLEYFYYDQVNATTSRADQCAISQSPCEYVETTYPSGYKYKREIEIDGYVGNGIEVLINFPMVFTNALENWDYLKHVSKGGQVENINGYDIIFSTTTDGSNPLSHELAEYNYRSGDIRAWISVPALSYTSSTFINMFYGNSSIATTTEDIADLWSEYAFVSHMNDLSSAEVSESASSTLIGDKASANSPTMSGSHAIRGEGQSFDGVDDYIDFGNVPTSLPLTISAWSTVGVADRSPYNLVTSDDSLLDDNYGVYMRLFDRIEIGFGDGFSTQIKSTDYYPGGAVPQGYIVGVIGGTDYADMRIYDDAAEKTDIITSGSDLSSYNTAASAPFVIGRREYGAVEDYNLIGHLDEVRVANAARSNSWIIAEYKNQTLSSFYDVSCQQRYSSSTNGDQLCSGSNPDYPSFPYSASTDPSCDVCEKHDANDFFKVIGGYNCSSCTIEDSDNSCEQNSLGVNRNRCEYCSYVYKTPGLMYDNKYNTIEASSTSACDPNQDDPSEGDFCNRGSLCGWGINSWTEDDISTFGLGWFQFSPRITSSSRPYFSVEQGNIYSKGNIYSRYSPPMGKFNATYLIESGGQITNIVSSSTLSDIYEGELSNRPTLDFFELLAVGSSRKYKSSLGLIDYTGITTSIDAGIPQDGTNKYGSNLDLTGDVITELQNPLGGSVFVTTASTTFDNSATSTIIYVDTVDSSGIIVVQGDLDINRDIIYEDIEYPANKSKITKQKLIPSLVWIVKGDVTIGPAVSELAGTFIVLGGDGTTCPEADCGTFDTGTGFNQLVVHGSVLAHNFILGRTYADSDGEPSEKFINEGRLQANPPRGLEDLNKLSPRYSF